jgi:Flp pilus assembly protein TadB
MDKNYQEGFRHEAGNASGLERSIGNAEPRHTFLNTAERMVQTVDGDLIRDVLKAFVSRLPEVVDRQLRLVRDEAREELNEGARKVIRAASPLGIGIAFAFFAVGFVLVTIACALALVIPVWAATLLMTLLTGIAALVLINVGKQRFQEMRFETDKTIQTLTQNVRAGVTQIAKTH